jgi:hypothetical protein
MQQVTLERTAFRLLSVPRVIIIFPFGYMKYSIQCRRAGLRFIICACYSWAMALNVGLDASKNTGESRGR